MVRGPAMTSSPWVIHKFGGTSVATAQRYRDLTAIVARGPGDLLPEGPYAALTAVLSADAADLADVLRTIALARTSRRRSTSACARSLDDRLHGALPR